jgi:TonB family protein
LVVLVDEAGRPVEITVRESEPSPAFGEAASAAARRWRFQKVTHGGQPVRYLIFAPVVFRIID